MSYTPEYLLENPTETLELLAKNTELMNLVCRF
jgi:hypothetical protein